MSRFVLILAPWLLVACTSQSVGPILPASDIRISPTDTIVSTQILHAGVVIGAIQLIYDPMAPNWSIDEVRVAEDTFRLEMRMKRFHIGGSGEAMQVLKRRARQLQEQGGYSSYRLSGYVEGIQSHTPVAQRYAEGTIQLVGKPEAPRAEMTPSVQAR